MDDQHFMFSKSDWVPNNPDLPVIIYKLGSAADAPAFEKMFSDNGWTGIWRNGVFDYHHYHSLGHEVLGVGKGSASLQIGGSDGKIFEVEQGDCLILPAGTGHKKLKSSADFEVVGAYPPGQEADIQTSAPTDKMLATIKALPKPTTDPVLGASAGLMKLWRNPTG